MSANGSIAVWCVPAKPHTSETPVGVEAHFNYWRISKSRESKDFFEIGIMVDDPSQIHEIKMYFPWTVTASAVTDCAKYFVQHHNIVRGIFNKVISVTTPADNPPRWLALADASGKISFRVHSFEENDAKKCIDDVELRIEAERKGGTILTITSHALSVAGKAGLKNSAAAYFRLRLTLSGDASGNPFVRIIPTFERLLLPGFEQIEFIDFRFNEVRTLPSSVVDLMEKDQGTDQRARFKVVAFLTAVPVRSQLTMSSVAPYKTRRLEDFWTNYADGIPQGMVVYHWKKESEEPILDFSTVVKLQTRMSGWKVVLAYLAIVFVVGTLASLLASWIWDVSNRHSAQPAQSAASSKPQPDKNSTDQNGSPPSAPASH